MSVGDAIREFVQTAFRLLPWPTESGLRRVGNPGAESPVLITGNYDLTVRRLMRALAGTDAWLVVAPSQGINVWCAAAGGLLSSSQVVTALKTCGIDEHVRHRRAVLPQLAATGVVATEVSRRCGWKVRFGPVYGEDIPRYLAANGRKDDSMRRVRFGSVERLEMATAWAVPTSLVVGFVMLFVEIGWLFPAIALVWAMSIGVFFAYDHLGRGRFPMAWAASAAPAVAFVVAADGSVSAIIATLVVATTTLAVLTFDFAGSTPIEGGSHFESKDWSINLDSEKCIGVYSCWAVCPEACFDKREDLRKVELSHEDRCIKCGACVVQCPQDALYFAADDGRRRIEPETIRRYKLNLLGSRAVDTGEVRVEVAESAD